MAIYACVSNVSTQEENKIENLAEACELVGIRHNQGLDSIYNELLKERVRLFNESATRSGGDTGFPETYDFDALIRKTTMRLTKNWYPETDDEMLETLLSEQSVAATRSSSADGESELMAQLTPFQREYCDRLFQMFDQGLSAEKFVENVITLEAEIMANAPTEEDAVVLLSTTSVARNSAEYWNENIGKWGSMLNSKIVDVPTFREPTTRGVPTITAPADYDRYYANPNDLHSFYMVPADTMYPIFMTCPEKLVWDQANCRCDFEWNIFWDDIGNSDAKGALLGGVGGAIVGVVTGGPVGMFFGTVGGVASCSIYESAAAAWDNLMR